MKRAATLGGALALLAILGSVAAVVPITDRVFHHHIVLFLSLLIAVVAYYMSYIARGTLSGNGRFGAYGTMLGAEGMVRIIATVALVVIGTHTAGAFGLALALPPVAAMLYALRGQKGLLQPGPQASYSELSTALGWLLLGSVLCQALSYSAYLAAVALETSAQAKVVGNFLAGILIARIPILGFQAVQAALLPKLASQASAGHEDEFKAGLRRLVMIVLAVGLIGAVGSFTVGHAAGRVLFGTRFTLGNRDLGLLAIGSGAFIFALTLAQALIALRSYAAATLSWLAGAIAFVAGPLFAHDLFLRCELGYALGSLGAAAAMIVCLATRLRSGIPIDALERLVEDVRTEPLEL